MAERGYSKEDDDYRHHALAVSAMVRQMQGASMSPINRFPNNRGRGRGRAVGYNKNYPLMHRRQRSFEPHSYDDMKTSPWRRGNFSQWNMYGDNSYEKQRLHSPLKSNSIDQPGDTITPESLVTLLTDFPDFSASLLQLMEQKHLNPKVVRRVVSTYPKVVSLIEERVVLNPDISVCDDYLGTEGCGDRSSCKKLHICQKFISETCNDQNCNFGHSWNTNHNSKVLEFLFLKHLATATLHKLLKKLTHKNLPIGKIYVCDSYNSDGCQKSDCGKLHVCLRFVLDYTKCPKADCQLNHDILDERSCQLLEAHGLSSNETPRDITVSLLAANPLLRDGLKKNHDNSVEGENKNVSQTDEKNISDDSNVMPKSNTKDENLIESGSEVASNNDSSNITSVDSHVSANNTVKIPDKAGPDIESKDNVESLPVTENKGIVLKVNQRHTLWSHYLHGDTLIPEICYYSVENTCKNEASICPRLHATQHFHWQVSETGNSWLNLRFAQVTALEYSFCDVLQDQVDLPRLDPASVDISARGLFILMGRDTWRADFKVMNLTNSTDTKKLFIRRLCTENIQGQVIKASSFVWFFLDKNNRWVKYGDVDTTGQTNLISNVTSNDIEKKYVENPSASFLFSNSRFKYILDFKTMVQTNQKTNMSREVRRRPEHHIQKEESESAKGEEENGFPKTWDLMQSTERVTLVTLASSSVEYQSVINLLAGELSTSIVIKIERIQNPFLWRALQNKIREMTTIYGDEAKVNVRQLFHGTGHNIVPHICSENFDWRLHGTNAGQKYGRGTYFSTSAKYSYCYCNADVKGNKHMFVARVAVGSIAAGNPSLVRPPINPVTKAPFDSTVDNISSFTILVKYDKQEYYPEYLLTLT